MPANRLVGEAYILMRADGRLLKRDMKKAGQGAGKELTNDFDKEIERSADTMQRRFKSAIADSFVGQDFSRFRKEFGTTEKTVDGLRAKLRALTFDEQGRLLPIKDRQLLKKTHDEIIKSLVEWGEKEKAVERTMEQNRAIKDREAAIERTAKAYATYGRNVQFTADREKRALEQQNKAWQTYAKNVQHTNESTQRAIDEQNRAWLTYGRNVEHTNTRHERAMAEQNKAWLTYGRNVVAATRDVDDHTAVVERHSSRVVRSMRTLRIQIDRVSDRTDHFGSMVGRVFGKGSRNNFLNFVGSTVSGLTRLFGALATFPFRAVSHIGDSFGTAFSASRAAGAGRLLSVGRGILGIFGGKGGLIGMVAGLALAAFGLGKVLPGIVSLLTMLGGAASALIGSVGIGLTGALLALTPAAIGAASALGSVFAVIATFAKDAKNKDFMATIFTKPLQKVTKEFSPKIKTFLTGIRSGFKVLLDDLKPGIATFFDTWERRMKDVDKRNGDVFDKQGKLLKAGKGDIVEMGTVTALERWSDSLGKISKDLNSAVTSFGSGLIAFFVPVLPYAERLSQWIETIAARFDKWAQSAEGQNAIADFMKDAWTNAKLVWDILGEIGSIIGTVFSSGNDTGTSFLEGIRSKLAEIDAFLKTPEGRSKLDNFFGDVKQIGEGFGTLVADVGTMIKNFNDPNARAAAKDLMESLVKIGDAAVKVTEMADAIGRIIDYLSNPVMSLVGDLVGWATGVDVNNPKPGGGPAPTPKPPAPLTGGQGPVIPGGTIDYKTTLNGQGFTKGGNDEIMYRLGLTPKQVVELAGYVVPIDMDTTTYEATKAIVQAFRFSGKQVPIDGNEAAWNEVKGTVAGYAFKPKVVPIDVNSTKLDNWIAWWNKKNLNKTATIRYATEGILPNGGRSTRGGVTAAGGTFWGAQQRTIGESGPEAVVPLNRPLGLVDPSVRALSAIAQGMRQPAMAAGGVGGLQGRGPVNVDLQVTTAAQNPYTVAAIVKDELMLALQ